MTGLTDRVLSYLADKQEYAAMKIENKAISASTNTQVTGLTVGTGGAGNIFQAGTDKITVKKAGTYLVIVNFKLSAAATGNTALKAYMMYSNGVEKQSAAGYVGTWSDVTHIGIVTLPANAVLTTWVRLTQGGGTIREGNILVFPF